ncbi:hypothetical protein OXPF_21220 [Oxobacter pfennigii]|uniref:Uncharacterized protein n=1 Tax=Oxobacter pfennigii TaxID=36849 RepID=A0A0P8WN42_9CLOT|nr:hypothetical protein [Oxobacter pfennigii]KPU43957.1 hypothetical protein OXPF_21220 [Oxobacter pfennigii]
MNKRKAGIITIICLILSIPLGNLTGIILNAVNQIHVYSLDIYTITSTIIFVIASLVYYNAFKE